MANDLKSYKGYLEAQVEKDALTGKYAVNISKYDAGVKIGDDTYEYTPESSSGGSDEPVEPTPDPEEPTGEDEPTGDGE